MEFASKKDILELKKLADSYQNSNPICQLLCLSQAEFLCEDAAQKETIHMEKERLMRERGISIPKVSIVIVSYNCCYMMQQCVESIREYAATESVEIIVVDNASNDGISEWLAQQPDIRLQQNTENVGFPAGCNQGIALADPHNDIFLLNNDTRLAKNALFWLQMGLYSKEKAGAVGCIANYCGNNQQIDVEFSLPGDYLEYAKSRNVFLNHPLEQRSRLCGFAMLINREVLNQTSLLDEQLSPGYFDDDDLSLQIVKLGYRLYVCRNSFIYHAGSQSFRDRSDLDQILMKNYQYMLQKWGFDPMSYALINEEALETIVKDDTQNLKVLEVGAKCGNTMSMIQYQRPDIELWGVEGLSMVKAYSVDTQQIVYGEWREITLPVENAYFDYFVFSHNKKREYFEYAYECFGRYLKPDGKIIVDFDE